MLRKTKLSTYVRKMGMIGRSASQSVHFAFKLLRPEIVTPRGAGLFDGDPMQLRQDRHQLFPDPHGHHFRGGVLQALDLIEQVVVEPAHDGVDRLLEISEVDQPTRSRVDLPTDRHLATEGVAMHAPALVPFWYIRQVMRRFESEIFDQLDGVHDLVTILL